MNTHRIKTALLSAALLLTVSACDSVTEPELAPEETIDEQLVGSEMAVSILWMDFLPIASATYNINWRVNQWLAWADVKRYAPTVFLSAPSTGTLFFYVMEDRPWYQNDIILGIVEANFSNSTTPTSFRYLTDDPTGNTTRNPSGAPFQITNGFWLGCTKKGRVRGNYDKGDNGHANVYLQRFNLAIGISIGGGMAVSNPRSLFCLPA